MKRLLSGLIILLIACATQAVIAQDDAPKPRYLVWEVQVEPAQMELLLNALDASHSLQKQKNYPFEDFIQHSGDGYLWASTQIGSMADIDKLMKTDQDFWKANPEEGEKIGKMFENAYSKVAGIVLELQPELSVMPAEQSTQTTGTSFRQFEKFYIKNGKMKEFSEQVKKFCELRKKNGFNQAMYTFYPLLGPDMSVVYFIDELGNNPADYFTKNDEAWKKFGEEGNELWNTVKNLLVKTEHHFGVADYDHSYFPKK
jgi:hypothetical protein